MIAQVRDVCSECGVLTLIQNKKHWICGECVFKRNHQGQSKQQVYEQRSKQKANNSHNTSQRYGNDKAAVLESKITKASKLTSVSSKKKYRCSDGTVLSQAEINWKLTLARDQIKQHRPAICQGTGRSDVPLSFSHTISVARCKELGKSELIFDVDNIEIEGFEAPTSNPSTAHNIWENGTMDKKIMLLNFERKLSYIKVHDSEQYNKIMIELQAIGYEWQVEL